MRRQRLLRFSPSVFVRCDLWVVLNLFSHNKTIILQHTEVPWDGSYYESGGLGHASCRKIPLINYSVYVTVSLCNPLLCTHTHTKQERKKEKNMHVASKAPTCLAVSGSALLVKPDRRGKSISFADTHSSHPNPVQLRCEDEETRMHLAEGLRASPTPQYRLPSLEFSPVHRSMSPPAHQQQTHVAGARNAIHRTHISHTHVGSKTCVIMAPPSMFTDMCAPPTWPRTKATKVTAGLVLVSPFL